MFFYICKRIFSTVLRAEERKLNLTESYLKNFDTVL